MEWREYYTTTKLNAALVGSRSDTLPTFRDPSISWYTGEIPHPITRTAGVNVKEWGADAAVFLPTRPGLKEEGKTTGPERE